MWLMGISQELIERRPRAVPSHSMALEGGRLPMMLVDELELTE